MARRQIEKLPQPSLRPAASPVDTHVRPASVDMGAPVNTGSSLMSIARALTQVDASLGQWFGHLGAKRDREAEMQAQRAEEQARIDQREEIERQEQQAEIDFAKTRKGFKQAVDEGLLAPTENPFYLAHYDKVHGQNTAQADYFDFLKQYNEQGMQAKSPQEVQAAYMALSQKRLDQFGSSPWFAQSYLKGGMAGMENVQQFHSQNQIKAFNAQYDEALQTRLSQTASWIQQQVHGVPGDRRNEETVALFAKYIQPILDGAVANGYDGTKLNSLATGLFYNMVKSTSDTALMAGYKTLKGGTGSLFSTDVGQQFFAGLAPLVEKEEKERRLNQFVPRISDLRDMASRGDPGTVEAALRLNQEAPDIFDADARLSVVDMYKASLRRNAVQNQEGRFEAEVLENALMLMESAGEQALGAVLIDDVEHRYTDDSGKEHTFRMPRSEIIKKATDFRMNAIAVDGAAKGLTEEQVFAKQAEFLARNGVTYDAWERLLVAGASAAAGPDFKNPGEASNPSTGGLPMSASKGYQLYKLLFAANPRLLEKQLPDAKAAAFYEGTRVAEEYLTDGNVKAAMMQAWRMQNDPDYRKKYGETFDWSSFDGQWKKLIDKSWWFTGEVRNPGVVRKELGMLTQHIMDVSGASFKTALAAASKKFSETWVQINGSAVRRVNQAIPENMEQIAAEVIKAFVSHDLEVGRNKYVPTDPVTGRKDQLTLGQAMWMGAESLVTGRDWNKEPPKHAHPGDGVPYLTTGDVGDYALVPWDENGNYWIVVEADSGLPVVRAGIDALTSYTLRDLWQIATDIKTRESAEAAGKAAAWQNEIQRRRELTFGTSYGPPNPYVNTLPYEHYESKHDAPWPLQKPEGYDEWVKLGRPRHRPARKSDF